MFAKVRQPPSLNPIGRRLAFISEPDPPKPGSVTLGTDYLSASQGNANRRKLTGAIWPKMRHYAQTLAEEDSPENTSLGAKLDLLEAHLEEEALQLRLCPFVRVLEYPGRSRGAPDV